MRETAKYDKVLSGAEMTESLCGFQRPCAPSTGVPSVRRPIARARPPDRASSRPGERRSSCWGSSDDARARELGATLAHSRYEPMALFTARQVGGVVCCCFLYSCLFLTVLFSTVLLFAGCLFAGRGLRASGSGPWGCRAPSPIPTPPSLKLVFVFCDLE